MTLCSAQGCRVLEPSRYSYDNEEEDEEDEDDNRARRNNDRLLCLSSS